MEWPQENKQLWLGCCTALGGPTSLTLHLIVITVIAIIIVIIVIIVIFRKAVLMQSRAFLQGAAKSGPHAIEWPW